jgi:hypothetical protein
MPYIDQIDGLYRLQDTGRQISNVRTLVVFSDGLVVCAVGVRGIKRFTLGPVPHGELLALVLIRLMGPGAQRALRRRREHDIWASAKALGTDGTAEAFAKGRRKALAIPFSEVTKIELTQTRKGRLLAIHTLPSGGKAEPVYPYLCELTADRVRQVLGPLVAERLKIRVPA